MLALQRCVDFNDFKITLYHDGTEPFPEECFAGYPYQVEQITIDHRGIAGVRNYAIAHSEGTWIKFNDCDDMFASIYSVRQILDALHESDAFDVLWFPFYFEYLDGRRFLLDDIHPVFTHNKLFRREFLVEKNIWFNEKLTWCEDSAFLALLEMEIDINRRGKIKAESPIYCYAVRMGSLCNRPEIKFANRESFFERHKYVAEEFRKHGHIDQYNTMVVRVMCDSFLTLDRMKFDEDTSELERRVWEYFRDHKQQFLDCTAENFDLVIEACNRERDGCEPITKDEFLKWLRQLQNKHKGVE